MMHDISAKDYLNQYNCHEEYEIIHESMRQQRAKNSPWSVEYYLSRGYGKEQALVQIGNLKEKRKNPATYPAHPDHWIAKGMDPAQGIRRAAKYKKDIGNRPNITKFEQVIIGRSM